MKHAFLDASAAVKRYTPEVGTAWIEALADPASGCTLLLAEITLAEVAAALAAKHRAPRGISLKERDDAVKAFLGHCDAEYQLTATSRAVVDRAVDLTQRHRLRGYDAVQLASALVSNEALKALGLGDAPLISADDDLLAAAQAEGLAVDNPNRHP